MKRLSGLYILIILLAISPVFLNSCKQDEELGLEVQPSEDQLNVGYIDTCSIVAYSIRDTAFRTDETLLNLLGSYADPVFGVSTAWIYTQFHIPDNNLSFGINPVADSLVLSLAYNGYYGDTLAAIRVNVNELIDDFYKDSSYYSNSSLFVKKPTLASVTFIPAPNDSVYVDGSLAGPHLRIKLDNSLGQKILNASATSDLSDNAHFIEFFKGLRISAAPQYSAGTILYFNLLSSLSRLTLYFHNDNDTSQYDFVIDEECARFSSFDHYNYLSADPQLVQQLNGDTSLGNNLLYLQPMCGIRVKIAFPHIHDLTSAGMIAINKAQLVIKVDDNTTGYFAPPEKIALIRKSNDGSFAFLPDEFFGEDYFGGKYDATAKEYRFTISKYLQDLLMYGPSYDKGLYLAVSGASVQANRLVFFGPDNTNGKLHLEIVYTKLY